MEETRIPLQSTTLVKNRYVLFILYCIVAGATGGLCFGWVGVQELLYKAGSFKDVCVIDPSRKLVIIGGAEVLDCARRRMLINTLSTICYSLSLSCAFLGGLMLDVIGPRLCHLCSHFMSGLAWGLIFFFPKSPFCLYAGFAIIGIFLEPCQTPAIVNLCDLFPSASSTVVSIIASLRSLSFVLPAVMSYFYNENFVPLDKLYIIGIVYLAAGHGFAFLLGFIGIPRRRLILQSVDSGPKKRQQVSQDTPLLARINLWVHRRLSYLGDVWALCKAGFKHPKCVEYFLLLIATSLSCAGMDFMIKASREFLVTSDGKSAVEIFKYTNCLTFIPAPVLGYMMDIVGPAVVTFVIHAHTMAYFVCAAIDLYATKVLACAAYVVSGSFIVSSVYCYANDRFPKRFFGRLTSIIFFCAGCLSLCSIPLYNYALRTKDFNFQWLALIMICVTGTACIMVAFLIYITKYKRSDAKVKLQV